jgi:hypothetical protein
MVKILTEALPWPIICTLNVQMIQMKKIYFLFFLIGFQQAFAQNGKESIKVTDMLKIKQLNSVTISPDGSKAAFLVNSIEPETDS